MNPGSGALLGGCGDGSCCWPFQTVKPRLTDLEDEENGLTVEELEERIAETEAKKRAVVLEMIG